MSNRFSKSNRDDNEPKITETLQRFGVPYFLLTPGAGADILVLLPKKLQLWEVKNPEQPPSGRKLTDTEQIISEYCEKNNIPYHVVENVSQAVKLIAAEIQEVTE